MSKIKELKKLVEEETVYQQLDSKYDEIILDAVNELEKQADPVTDNNILGMMLDQSEEYESEEEVGKYGDPEKYEKYMATINALRSLMKKEGREIKY